WVELAASADQRADPQAPDRRSSRLFSAWLESAQARRLHAPRPGGEAGQPLRPRSLAQSWSLAYMRGRLTSTRIKPLPTAYTLTPSVMSIRLATPRATDTIPREISSNTSSHG